MTSNKNSFKIMMTLKFIKIMISTKIHLILGVNLYYLAF